MTYYVLATFLVRFSTKRKPFRANNATGQRIKKKLMPCKTLKASYVKLPEFE